MTRYAYTVAAWTVTASLLTFTAVLVALNI